MIRVNEGELCTLSAVCHFRAMSRRLLLFLIKRKSHLDSANLMISSKLFSPSVNEEEKGTLISEDVKIVDFSAK